MALYDEIQKNLSSLAATNAPVTDETAKSKRLLRAKSGKAVSGTGIGDGPSVAEQSAVQQTQMGLDQLKPQIAMQKEAIGLQQEGQQQQVEHGQQQIAQQRNFDTIQNRMKTDQILNDLERNKGQLDLEKDRARIEQVGTMLALQDKKYVDQLENEGRKARLDSDIEFKDQLSKSILGKNEELLRQKLGDQGILDAKKRDFNAVLANLSIDDAIQVLKNELAQQRAMAPWELGGNLAQTGAQAYGAYENSQEKAAQKARQDKMDQILTRSNSSSGDLSINEALLTSNKSGIS